MLYIIIFKNVHIILIEDPIKEPKKRGMPNNIRPPKTTKPRDTPRIIKQPNGPKKRGGPRIERPPR